MPDGERPTLPPRTTGAGRRLIATLVGGAVLTAIVLGAILIARGDGDEQTDYDESVAERFLSVCTADAADLGFTDPDGFCRCSYDRIRAEIPYERFVEIDAAVSEDPGGLPDEIDRIRTECFADPAAGAPSVIVPTSAPSASAPSTTATAIGG